MKENFDEELFESMLDIALNTKESYEKSSLHATEVNEKLINEFGIEKTKWFYENWDKI